MKNRLSFAPMLAASVASVLLACDLGPSESEYLAVCVKEGQSAANQRLSKAMGINRDTFCKCAAKDAQALSADGRRWMLLNMQNKKEEARALQAKLNDAQQTELMAAAIEVSAKCATGEVLGPVKKP